MTTQANRDLLEIQSRIKALDTALANGERIVRYADGTYIEFSSFEELSQRRRHFETQLAEAQLKPRHTGVTLRVNRGIN